MTEKEIDLIIDELWDDIEDKTPEPKFKVGDKVIYDDYICKIEFIRDNHYTIRIIDGDVLIAGYGLESLTLYKEKKKLVAPDFIKCLSYSNGNVITIFNDNWQKIFYSNQCENRYTLFDSEDWSKDITNLNFKFCGFKKCKFSGLNEGDILIWNICDYNDIKLYCMKARNDLYYNVIDCNNFPEYKIIEDPYDIIKNSIAYKVVPLELADVFEGE